VAGFQPFLSGRFSTFGDTFDADSGKVLWETVLGGSVQTSTISYAVNGRQYVAVLTGEGSITGGILQHVPDIQPPRGHNAIYVFTLSESR